MVTISEFICRITVVTLRKFMCRLLCRVLEPVCTDSSCTKQTGQHQTRATQSQPVSSPDSAGYCRVSHDLYPDRLRRNSGINSTMTSPTSQ